MVEWRLRWVATSALRLKDQPSPYLQENSDWPISIEGVKQVLAVLPPSFAKEIFYTALGNSITPKPLP